MTSIAARTGLTLAIAFAIILVTAPASRSASSRGSELDRTCHLDATEKRKVSEGNSQWLIRQLDRWCVKDGRIVSVRQTLEVEVGPDWKLVSKSGTTRTTTPGTAISQGRFHLARRDRQRSCYPRVTGTLRTDGTASYAVDTGC